MHAYKVGDLYNSKIKSWPEGTQYNFRGGQHELIATMTSPTGEEKQSWKRGAAEFAFAEHGQALFLLFRFAPGIPWSDAPFSIHRVPAPERQAPAALETELSRALIHCLLIDGATGRIAAMRVVSFTPAFTRAFHAAITAQLSAPYSDAGYNAAIDAAYKQWPDTPQMLAAATAYCRGGEA